MDTPTDMVTPWLWAGTVMLLVYPKWSILIAQFVLRLLSTWYRLMPCVRLMPLGDGRVCLVVVWLLAMRCVVGVLTVSSLCNRKPGAPCAGQWLFDHSA